MKGRLHIAVSGASGLIGSNLVPYLRDRGHTVLALVRREAVDPETEITFKPDEGTIDSRRLEEIDVVIHLAGENIGSGRWTEDKKRRLTESRVKGTRLISETLASLDNGPKLLLAASATGYYGDTGDDIIDEDSPGGDLFLSHLCRQWEEATRPAQDAGIRVVNFRLGVVLTEQGGALAKMLPVFRLGLGGKIGSGQQYMSWISLDDVRRGIDHLITVDNLSGPVNFVSPLPVTNAEFTKTLGAILHRPILFTVPAFALRLIFGQMAEETLLLSCRVVPKRLAESGFVFSNQNLAGTLRDELR